MNHLAIDLGGRKSFVCIRNSAGTILQQKELETAKLGMMLKQEPRSRVIVETCAEGFGVADLAEAAGHEVRVVPSTLVRSLGVGARGIKTDRRDAQVLSEVSCRIDLPSVHIPSQVSRELKSALGMRQALVTSRTKIINTVRGYFRARRLRPRTGGAAAFAKRVRELAPYPDFVECQLLAIDALTLQIAAADKLLVQQADADPVCQRLMTTPGVGPIVSLAAKASFDDITRFPSAHRAASYLGLVPGENSSSERLRKTSITKAGQPFLRWLLVQAAHRARMSSPQDPMVLWSREVEKRRGRNVAVVALARKLAGILYAMWKKGKNYDAKLGATAMQ